MRIQRERISPLGGRTKPDRAGGQGRDTPPGEERGGSPKRNGTATSTGKGNAEGGRGFVPPPCGGLRPLDPDRELTPVDPGLHFQVVTSPRNRGRFRVPRKAPITKRLTLLFALGVLAGYFWLSPVFVPPGSMSVFDSGQSVERILRVLSVLLVFPLVWKRAVWLGLHEPVLRLVLWAFVVAPSLSLLSFPGLAFVVTTLAPFVVGGLSLLCLCALKRNAFSAWASGVGLTAVVFLGMGLSRYGLEMSSYYHRPRAHFGFIHPTQSASVVIIAGLFLAQGANRLLWRELCARRMAVGIICFAAGILLYLATSRNTLVALLAILAGAGYTGVVRRPMFRYGAAIGLLVIVCAMYIVAAWGDSEDALWSIVDQFSSARMQVYRDLTVDLNQETLSSILLGPSEYTRHREGGFSSFAAIDSVYLTVYLNYGLVTLVSLFAFLFALSRKLSGQRAPLAYGCLWAIIVFFAIDAQGVTPSNLAIFMMLAYALRNALRLPIVSASARYCS